MIFYGRQSIDNSDIKSVVKTLRSDWLTQGPNVLNFEKALARYCGTKYAVAVNSGTAALHLAYLAAGLKAGDEVITTPNTFVATTNMILACGAKPVFCDIRLDTYNIDESKIEELITDKTKAIVSVHFAGHPCEMEKIKKIAKKYKLLVIEDAAHALGARYKNSKIGSCRDSDLAIFSFHPVKSITTGEGGAILTNNHEYYEKLLLLRSHGIVKDKQGFNLMKMIGYNYRLTDIQAALGLSQLKKLNRFIKKRHQIVSWYKKGLLRNNNIILPRELAGIYSSWHMYIIRTREKKDRIILSDFLKKNGIGVSFHYPPVYSHPYYRLNGFGDIRCAVAEKYASTALTLPLYPLLSKAKVDYICQIINSFYAK